MRDYSMSEKERGRAFPIHVEMGEDVVLDLGEHATAVNLPDKGCVLVDYEKNDDGTLMVKTICLPGSMKGGKMADEEDEPESLEEALGDEAPMADEQGDDEDDDDEE